MLQTITTSAEDIATAAMSGASDISAGAASGLAGSPDHVISDPRDGTGSAGTGGTQA